MQKLAIVIFIAATMLLGGCKRAVTETTWQQMGLKGKVKALEKIEFKLVPHKKGTDTVQVARTVYTFNNRGFLAREENYNQEDTLNWTVYSFDGKGRHNIARKYHGDSSFCYKIVYEFDKEGYNTLRTTYDEKGELHLKIEAHYGENGRLNSEDSYWEGKMVLHRYRWLYNDKGQPAVFYQLRSDSSQLLKIVYSYDEKGDKTEEKRFDGDDKQALLIKYSYPATDKQNNWLQQLITEDGQPTSWVVRKITYF